MDRDALLTQLAADAEALAAGGADVLRAPVPTCPGWDVAELVGHLGAVHRWAAALVEAGGERVARRDLPGPPTTDLLAWYLESAAHLVAVLRAADPAAPAWTFSSRGDRSGGWWVRRQAVETALHRVDVDLAAGRPAGAVGLAVATAGIEELVTDLLPGALAGRRVEGLGGTLHLHATDTGDAEWLLDLDADPVDARPGHAKAATAVRGPASELLLWLHNRAGADRLEVLGDGASAAAWSGVHL